MKGKVNLHRLITSGAYPSERDMSTQGKGNISEDVVGDHFSLEYVHAQSSLHSWTFFLAGNFKKLNWIPITNIVSTEQD